MTEATGTVTGTLTVTFPTLPGELPADPPVYATSAALETLRAELLEAVAPVAELTSAVEDVVGSAASIEDLFASTHIIPNLTSISTAQSWPVLVVPYPMRIVTASVVFWGGSGVIVPASDSAYWQVLLRAMGTDGTTLRTLREKTTRVTDGAHPAGEAIASRKAWTFSPMDVDVDPGEIVNLAVYPQGGTPPALPGAAIITLGVRPR